MGMDKELGSKVTVTAGTPVIFSSADLWVESFMVEPLPGNTGKIYIKNLAGTVRAWLPPPLTNLVISYTRYGRYALSFNLKDFYIDSDVSGEGGYISANIA